MFVSPKGKSLKLWFWVQGAACSLEIAARKRKIVWLRFMRFM